MAVFPKYAQGRAITTQTLDFTSVSAGVTSAFGAQTYMVRLAATAPVHYRVHDAGVTSVATSADPLLPMHVVEVVGVTPGQRLTAVKAAGGAVTSADGRMTVTEIS